MSEQYDAADALMLTGTTLSCPDCGDDRIFVAAEQDSVARGWLDYVCTDCGAAVSLPGQSPYAESISQRASRAS